MKNQDIRDSFLDEDGNDLVNEVKRRAHNKPETKNTSAFRSSTFSELSLREPKRANSDINDLSIMREKMVNDLYHLKEIENDHSLRILDKKRNLAAENMKIKDALMVNESLSSFEADDNRLSVIKPKKLSDFTSSYPNMMARYSKNSSSKENSDALDLYLETTDRLIDDAGTVYAENQSVRYVGKALFNPGENSGVSLIHYKPQSKSVSTFSNKLYDEQNDIDRLYSTIEKDGKNNKYNYNVVSSHFVEEDFTKKNAQTLTKNTEKTVVKHHPVVNYQTADLKKIYGLEHDDKIKIFKSASYIYQPTSTVTKSATFNQNSFSNQYKGYDTKSSTGKSVDFSNEVDYLEAEKVLKEFDFENDPVYSKNFNNQIVSRHNEAYYAIDDPGMLKRPRSKTNLKVLASKKDGEQLINPNDDEIWDPGFYELEEEQAYKEKFPNKSYSNFTKVEWG